MLQPSNPHIQKIMYIRDVLINRAFDAPQADMWRFTHRCGTPSCVLGHLVCDPVMEMQDLMGKIRGLDVNNIISMVSDRLGIPCDSIGESRYGFELFGGSGTREERKAVCDRIIEQMLAEVNAV